MKKHWKTYLSCLLLITVFVMKGLVDVLPGLLAHTENADLVERLNTTQNSEENSQGEKKGEGIKELFLDSSRPLLFWPEGPVATQQYLSAIHLLYKQRVYLSIPTPPPELG